VNKIVEIKNHLRSYGGKTYRANETAMGYNSSLHPKMGESGKKAFKNFKDICDIIEKNITERKEVSFNQWQNSGNMIDYFWCQFKNKEKINSASSISLFARADSFELVIEWDSKKSAISDNTLQEHNLFINNIEQWIELKNIDINKYSITVINLSKLEEYKLEEFLLIREKVKIEKGDWIRIGRKYFENDEEILIKEVAKMMNELEFLYNCTSINNNKVGNLIDRKEVEQYHERDYKVVLKRINQYINGNGYIYSYEELSNFYLSLKTKPFVILAGISGTGKSKLVRLFAESINAKFKSIPVKPDWNDSTELLGYKNIKDEFVKGELYKVIDEAKEHLDTPYFVCLDEMNLARVEYYLSEYLSVIESRKFETDKIVTDKLFSESYFENVEDNNISIPENLYIIGTVNMDDTTFSFSRKVLDRANTIEFSEVDLETLDFLTDEAETLVVDNSLLKTQFLNIKDALEIDRTYVEEINEKIVEINNILKPYSKHFGYRVRDEIVFYMLENKLANLLEEDMAFDYQIMQKILPTIIGSDVYIEEILIKLFKICTGFNLENKQNYIKEAESVIKNESEKCRYPKSATKILQMLKGYRDGFVSFWQ